MEALTKLGIDFKILIAQMINFGILLAILIKLLYRPILNALETRSKRIEKSLKKAEEIDRQAVAAEEEYQKKLAATKKEMQGLMETAKADAKTTCLSIVAASEEEAGRMKDSAHVQIEAERKALYADVKGQTGKLALLMMTKAFRHAQGDDFYRQSIDAALKEMEAKI